MLDAIYIIICRYVICQQCKKCTNNICITHTLCTQSYERCRLVDDELYKLEFVAGERCEDEGNLDVWSEDEAEHGAAVKMSMSCKMCVLECMNNKSCT